MKTPILYLSIWALLWLLLLTTCTSSPIEFNRKKDSVSTESTPIQANVVNTPEGTLSTPITEPGITVQAIQKYAQSTVQTQTNLDIEVSVANFRVEGNEVLVDACYQLPDDLDWTVDKATIVTTNSVTLPLSAGSGLEFTQTLDDSRKRITTFGETSITSEETDESAEVPNHRCDTLYFGPIVKNADLSSFKLTIHSLIAIPREGQECQTFLNQVQPALDAKNTGVQIDCTQDEGGARIYVVQKPDSMSQEEAEAVVSANTMPNTVQGEWLFEGGVD